MTSYSKKQKFNDLIWDREYLKALDFYKENKDEIVFNEIDFYISDLAEKIHELGNYQESYELHKMIFENDPDQIELNFFERLNESWIKINGFDYEKYYKCFYESPDKKHAQKIIENCPECGKKLTKVIYGYIVGVLDNLGDEYMLGGCVVDKFNILRFCKNCGAKFNQYDLYGPNLEKIANERLTKKEIDEINIVYVELEDLEDHGSLPIHLLEDYFKKEFGINNLKKIINQLELAGYVYLPIEDYIKIKK